ncbi:hypothetical protein NHX12_030455 [Muraenolepis orangiensis]|uniref:transketolase n=1 Tax=Muraenolepis orangiensis TaxID=630683 RepID=A0A9Q0E9I8_9TELE|nr:hypothetical protein NHX12_030455 [Muraenolepis orangiensis]
MEDYHKPDQQTVQALRNIAIRLRVNCIKATTAAGTGYPTSCCSVAEIMSVLFFHTMKYRPEDPRYINNDRFILSKRTLLWRATLLLGSSLWMLPPDLWDRVLEWPAVWPTQQSTLTKPVWEAMSFASYYQLDNLVAIMDINRLGQSEPAPLQHHLEKYQKRCEAFGWHTIIVDGHSVEELCKALSQARHQPTAILAKTVKGKGIPAAEDKIGWHGKPLSKEMAEVVVKELQSRLVNSSKRLYQAAPTEDSPPVSLRNIRMPSAPSYKTGEKVSTRKAYGMAIAKLGRYNERVVALDGDTNNLTYSEIFKNEHPNRFVECYIAQQNMVSVAMGCAARDRNIVFASTLACFFTRAYDQLRMAAISESNINLCGSHCGVSTGEEGPSQMGLEDISMFRTLPTATIFYPSDGVSAEKAVELAAITKGVCYIRTSRPENATIYNSNEDFHVGQSKVVYQSKEDQVTVVAAGVTLHEALAAAEHLKKERIYVRVIDPFTIKPLDTKTIIDHTRATRGRILTVEDHYYEGGLGEAVAAAVVNESNFTQQRLAVSHTPRSGKPHELLKMYGIDRDAIVQAIRKMVNNSANAK